MNRLREVAGTGNKGEVRPTPAFRLLRVGAELCVNESRKPIYRENTVFFVKCRFANEFHRTQTLVDCLQQFTVLTCPKTQKVIHR